MTTQRHSLFVRDKTPDPTSPAEIDREARALWDNIGAETHTQRLTHAQRVSRLYHVCRDLQQAARDGAGLNTLRAVVKLLDRILNQTFAARCV